RTFHGNFHRRLGGQVKHVRGPEIREHRPHRSVVGDVHLEKRNSVRHVGPTASGQVVQRRHFHPPLAQGVYEVTADKPGSPGDQRPYVGLPTGGLVRAEGIVHSRHPPSV